ncbi:MAG: hypothetical protein J6X39_02190 [Bacteroidales bacterium]|nr:hypothetical protein [Bacteroidales bacterium]
MHNFSTSRLSLSLHHPTDGFYLGTRFDRGGVFDSILLDGIELAGRWFERYDPYMHDAVCGPAEEFTVLPFEGLLLKIGVGLLKDDGQPYDRFKLYEISDPGVWEAEASSDSICFKHHLEGVYDYQKEIVLTGPNSFEIRHRLDSLVPIETEVYNHNFFTMGSELVGDSRRVDLPFAPVGPGGMQYAVRISDGPLAVNISGDVPVVRTLLWANQRVACPEPYNKVRAYPGKPFTWNLKYNIDK